LLLAADVEKEGFLVFEEFLLGFDRKTDLLGFGWLEGFPTGAWFGVFAVRAEIPAAPDRSDFSLGQIPFSGFDLECEGRWVDRPVMLQIFLQYDFDFTVGIPVQIDQGHVKNFLLDRTV
jgi:hypothetical protein